MPRLLFPIRWKRSDRLRISWEPTRTTSQLGLSPIGQTKWESVMRSTEQIHSVYRCRVWRWGLRAPESQTHFVCLPLASVCPVRKSLLSAHLRRLLWLHIRMRLTLGGRLGGGQQRIVRSVCRSNSICSKDTQDTSSQSPAGLLTTQRCTTATPVALLILIWCLELSFPF